MDTLESQLEKLNLEEWSALKRRVDKKFGVEVIKEWQYTRTLCIECGFYKCRCKKKVWPAEAGVAIDPWAGNLDYDSEEMREYGSYHSSDVDSDTDSDGIDFDYIRDIIHRANLFCRSLPGGGDSPLQGRKVEDEKEQLNNTGKEEVKVNDQDLPVQVKVEPL